MSNLNRIEPRDGERIDEDSCPDCFHAKDECVCATCDNCNGYGEVMAGDPDIGQPEYPQQCAKCEGTGTLSRPEPENSLAGRTGTPRAIPDKEQEYCDWLDNLPKPPAPLPPPYWCKAAVENMESGRHPFE